MSYRWINVNLELDGVENPARFIGGAGEADLWHCDNDVVICQYPNDDDYVSYVRADAIWDVVSGKLTEENNPNVVGAEVGPHTPNAYWGGKPPQLDHKPKEVLHYLMCFAPQVFSDKVREEILTAIEQGELQ